MRLLNRLGGYQKGICTKGWRKKIIGNKVRNEIVITNMCTLAKCDEKVKIIQRGLGNGDWGSRDGGDRGSISKVEEIGRAEET